MADNTNNIDIAVSNGVDAGIAPRLIQIADASDRAALSVGSLKSQLSSVNLSGLGGLASLLNGVKGGVSDLSGAERTLTVQVRASDVAVKAQTISLAEARAERARLRAENAGVAISEQFTQAQWEKSIATSTRASAAQQGLSQARQKDAELQEFAGQVANALSGQLEAQAQAQAVVATATKEATAALTAQEAAEERAQASWQASIATQERQIATQTALSEARQRDIELQAFSSEIGDALAAQLERQALASKAAADAEKERTAIASAAAESAAAQVAASEVLSSQNEHEAAAYLQLAEATATVKEAKASLSALLKDINAGNIAEQESTTLLAAAIANETSATEQLNLAKTNLAEVQEYLAGATAAVTRAMTAEAAATAAASAATRGQVSANLAGAAAIGVLEGRTLSTTRAATNFLSRVVGLGPLLQAAFPIIGAVALLAVLYQMGDALYKVIKGAIDAAHNIGIAFDSLISPLRKSNDELAVTNDKLDQTIARLEHKPTTNGAALALDEARLAADKLDSSLERVDNELDKILKKNQINALTGILTGQESTRDVSDLIGKQFANIEAARDSVTEAIDKATEAKDPKAAQAAVKSGYDAERQAILGVIGTLNEEYNTRKKLQDQFVAQGRGGNITSTPYGPVVAGGQLKDQTANLTELGKSVKLAHEELRGLDLTMDNIGKNNAVDHLRDNASSLKADAKEAAAQWKQLLADFVAFQTAQDNAGHKATPQQNLDFLVGRESTINPLNRDKLQAKELPYRNELNGSDFIAQQTAKLQDQVATIGLYNNALKEQNELDKIQEAARKKHIDLTAQDITVFKGLIAQIVESKDYTKELNSIYEAVNEPEQKHKGAIEAINTLYERGQLTTAQYNQGLKETAKQYDEATSAVTKFQHALADQQRDSVNKLGTDRQVAVKSELQGLDERLRQPNADAQHPFGYSEAEIKKVNDALTPLIQAQQDKNALDQASNQLIEQQANLEDKLIIQEQALAAAVKAGAISQAAADAERLKGQASLNQLQVDNGTITSASQPFLGAAAQDYVANWQGVAKGIQDAFAPVFKTLTDGFADSIGRAIVYSKNLGDALRDVARSAISELISGLIKLAIQYVIITALKKAFDIKDPTAATPQSTAVQTAASIGAIATTTAASLLAASLLAPAWWTVAEAVSIASFGAADVAGISGIAAVKALGTAAQAHKDGGFITGPGSGVSDSIPALLSNGEFVVNAAATSRNRDLLDTINSGGQPSHVNNPPQSGGNGGSQSTQMSVEVHNYGSTANVQVQQIDENRVRLIVRDEAPQLVAQHAPSVIANDIANPNGKTSKSIYRNITPSRVR